MSLLGPVSLLNAATPWWPWSPRPCTEPDLLEQTSRSWQRAVPGTGTQQQNPRLYDLTQLRGLAGVAWLRMARWRTSLTWVMQVALCGHKGLARGRQGAPSQRQRREDGSRGWRDGREPGTRAPGETGKDKGRIVPESLPKERGPADALILASDLQNHRRIKVSCFKPLKA